jgi:hypothetical protein
MAAMAAMWWDAPFLGLVAAAIAALIWRPTLRPLERACAFFAIGDIDATIANAIVLAGAGLGGLLYNLAAARALDYGAAHLALALSSGLGLGLALARLAAHVGGDGGAPPGAEV